MMYQWIVQTPSAAAQALPMQFRQLYGVTPWPAYGQSAAVNAILTAFGNLVYPGVERFFSNPVRFGYNVVWGTASDV